MKEMYTNLKKKSTRFLWVILMFPLLMGTLGTATAQSDLVSEFFWLDQSPRQDPSPLVLLGNAGYLYINAVVLYNDVVRSRIKVTLPPGLDFDGTTKATILTSETDDPNMTPGACFTAAPPAPTGTVAAGRTWYIDYLCNTSTLRVNDTIVMKIKVVATCTANIFDAGKYIIDITSLTGDFILGYTTTNASVQKPSMRIVPTPQIVTFPTVGSTQQVTLQIDAQNGYVNSTLITLAYNSNIITLSNFEINGNLLANQTLPSNAGIGVFHSGTGATRITNVRLDQTVFN